MLKKLRIKFVVLNMATVAIVLTVVFTSICIINYQQSTSEVYSALNSAIGRAGDAPDKEAPNAKNEPVGSPNANTNNQEADGSADANVNNNADSSTNSNTSQEEPPEKSQNESTPPEIGGEGKNKELSIPMVVCKLTSTDESDASSNTSADASEGASSDSTSTSTSSTSTSTSSTSDSTLEVVSSATTASISEDVLAQTKTEIEEAPEGSGFLSAQGLFYVKRSMAGTTYVAFADASAAASWQQLALILAGVGAASLLVFLIISIFFARWALHPVEETWNKQQQFVADASHELKTPLTVILANAAILRAHPELSIASQSQWIESTQNEAERMQELVCDMLDLAKPETTKTESQNFERVDLSELVQGDVLQFESVAFERNISLSPEIDANVNVCGISARLHRLVSTLLDNACKYANEGGEVDVCLHQSVRAITLSIHNSGESIPQADLPHIFDRFYRADKARTNSNDAKSYGLGLAIAREIALEHKGSIEVSSNEGEGTTFIVKFPTNQ